MKTKLTTAIILLVSLVSFSQTFSFEDLNYTVTSTSPNTATLSGGTGIGDLIIPATVTNPDTNVTYNVTAISNSVFRGDSLTSVVIPDTVITIGNSAFRGNDLISITLGSGLQSIGELAFAGNSTQTTIISTAITPPTIGANAIGRRAATNLTVPAESAVDYIINGWTDFLSINGQTQTDFIGFTIDNITYEIKSFSPNTVETVSNTNSGAVVIPSIVSNDGQDYTVTEIGFGSFSGDGLTSISIPNTVIVIGENSLSFNDLTTITIPTSVTTIEGRALQSNKFSTMVIPNSVTTIGALSFAFNELTSVIISENLTTIPSRAFAGNNLQNITIPENVTTLGERAFEGNELIELTIPVNVSIIGDETFNDNNIIAVTSLNEIPPTLSSDSFSNRDQIAVTVPQGKETAYVEGGWTDFFSINDEVQVGISFTVDDITYIITSLAPNTVTLTNTNNLDGDLVIPETINFNNTSYSITAIGANAIDGSLLTSITTEAITAPIATATSFGDNSLLNLNTPDGLQNNYEVAGWTGFFSINGEAQIGLSFIVDSLSYTITEATPNTVELSGGNAIGDLVVPETVVFNNFNFTVTTIGTEAFRNSSLTSLVIPNNITIIGASAFRGSELASITLGSGLTTIGELAFAGNAAQTTIISRAITPPTIGVNAIAERAATTVTVPAGRAATYEAADWTGFKAIIEAEGISINLKVFLQGASLNPNTGEETLMRDDLRLAGLVPTTSPYIDALTITSTVLETTGDDAVVDWVFIQLRDATDNSLVIAEQSALVQRDGDIVTTDGVSVVAFTVDASDYYVSISHRNHLGLISANTVSLSSTVTSLDFTNDSSLVAGGTTAIASLSSGVFAMFSGDTNNDAGIRLTDRTQIRTVLGERDFYSNDDIDMNGIIQLSEITLLVQNLGNLQQFTTEE